MTIFLLCLVGGWLGYHFVKGMVLGPPEEDAPVVLKSYSRRPQLAPVAAEKKSEPAKEESIAVDIEPIPLSEPEPNPKETQVARTDGTFPFTLSLKQLIRVALNDPSCSREIAEAIKEGPLPGTTMLGAANFAAPGEPEQWFSLFMSTNREAGPGNRGYIFRNKQGDRISMRLKAQGAKDQRAQHINAVLPADQGTADLLSRAMAGDQKAAQAVLQMAKRGPQPIESAHISLEDIL